MIDTERTWKPTRWNDLAEVQPGRAAARLKTPFGMRDYVGTILVSRGKGGDGDRRTLLFHADSGLFRPLEDFAEFCPM